MPLATWRRLGRAETRLAGEGATIAGVDEAGRGPLAGPVVAAAVILDRDVRWDGIDDRGRRVASGVYYVTMQTAGETRHQKLVLVR